MKMQSVGFDYNTIDCVKNLVSSRKQLFVLRGTSSNWQPVTSGVPQVSVLGQFLLFIYIIYIDEGMESQIIKFADDTKLYRSIRSEQDDDALQKELDQIEQWSSN